MAEYTFPDITDRLNFHASAYISPNAWINGTVSIGRDSSVWNGVTIRGDEGVISIGERCNVQDGCVLHADPHAYLTIGSDVSLGHGAIVHGCTIEDEVLVGMGAVVLNGARIGRGSLIAARALVPEGMDVPPGSLVKGIPGKVSPLRSDLLERVRRTARNYVELKQLYLVREREGGQGA